jgi:hypothetical protein
MIAPGRGPVAFAADEAREALAAGQKVAAGGVELVADGGGMRARTRGGKELPTHQAFLVRLEPVSPRDDAVEADRLRH